MLAHAAAALHTSGSMKPPVSILAGSILAATTLVSPCSSLQAAADAPERHVVLMVWDGMRPDMISEKNTPTLFKLAHDGVNFAHNHSVYPTSTEVNGTTIATGVYPSTDHIIGNKEYRPEIDAKRPIPTEHPPAVKRGDAIAGGKYIAVPTLAEIIQQAGFPTAVAGTKTVALLHDRSENKESDAGKQSQIVFAGRTIPSSLLDEIVKTEGAGFPPVVSFPNTAQDHRTSVSAFRVHWKIGGE